ncbi:MAG: tRNA pseudouridine(38-40) synthase TruA [Erysipelotrichales bacterium]|nr:tRNA pseudouridine(38-40) synthase TruA [Erysipelotrichales bacterium]
MRYKASVSYDGSKFYGFQRLGEKKSVQGELERALTKINKSEVLVKGAGRTDRGVHALDQAVHFDLDVFVPPERLVNAINSIVKPDIFVNSVSIVSDDFHARFNVLRKTYTYVINLGKFDTIKDNYLYNYNRCLNIRAMKKSAKLLLGPHSFHAFTSGARANYNSIIYKIKFKKKRGYLYITFVGKSFYRYMVRNMVGTLISVGEGKLENRDILAYLTDEKASIHYTTVPANGLYLVKIDY